MIAGFVEASAGRIFFGNEDVTDLPPNKRNTGMVFQGFALFPHMTVWQNVAYGLEMRRVPKDEMKTRVAKVLELVQLGRFCRALAATIVGGAAAARRPWRARLVINPHVAVAGRASVGAGCQTAP